MEGAGELGGRLLREIEIVDLDEILHTLRLQDGNVQARPFGLPQLHRLAEIAMESRPKTNTTPPTIELMSVAPGGGKTHLLYHLCALATLPIRFGGKQACVVVVDADGNFSVPRLAAQVTLTLRQHSILEPAIDETVNTALKHVHIFRPQSLASTIATLDALPTYLFDCTRHHSFDRAVSFIAIDSTSPFYWSDRAEAEDAAFLAATSSTAAGKKHQSGYITLSTSLKLASKTLHCPALFTTRHLGPSQQQQGSSRGFRPAIPGLLTPDLRLVVRRCEVPKFPAGYGVVQAERERAQRLKAVREGRFEGVVSEGGLDERGLLRFVGAGFEFRIGKEGVVVSEET